MKVSNWLLALTASAMACHPTSDRVVSAADSLASRAQPADTVRDARVVSTGNPSYPVLGASTAKDTGRVLYTAASRYAVITGAECPGQRTVNERLHQVRDLIVRISEDNTEFDCREGARSLLTATVWHSGDSVPLTTIRAGASSGIIVSTYSNEDFEPVLLQALDYGCCGSPDDYRYFDLRSGRLKFTAQRPLMRFAASGYPRYVAVGGGSHDTIATLQYGDGRRDPQRLAVVVPGHTGYMQLDSATIAGPRSGMRPGYVVVGKECCAQNDTVAVSGVIVRLYPAADDGLGSFEVLVNIVNDRLQLAAVVVRRP